MSSKAAFAFIAAFVTASGRATAGDAPSLSPSSAAATPAPAFVRPAYAVLRDEEDWRGLRDATGPRDAFDGLKYVPLDANGTRYATFGAEAREFYEHSFAANWNPRAGSNGYVLQRYLVDADVHAGRARAFVELESAFDYGRKGGSGPNDADGLDPTQAFLEVDLGGAAGAPGAPLALQAGRFGLDAGAGRVLAVNDGPGVRNAFDGIRAIVRAGGLRTDFFAVHPVAVRTGAFDDAPDASRSLFGAYVARVPHAAAIWEAYALGDDRTAAYQRGRAHETRYTVGSRVGRTRGRVDGEFEAAYQFGTFGTHPIAAFALAGEAGITFPARRSITRASLAAGVGSGDHGTATLGAFRPPTFKGQYFGAIGANGPIDSVGFEPALATTFDRRVTASIAYASFARQSRSDGIYGIAGNLLVPGRPDAGAEIGRGPLVSLLDRLDAHASAQAIYQRSFAGSSLRGTSTDADIAYYRLVLDYKW